ncbi:unnamed protein product [marine sediment metagenome]|uniref:Uncharacterized protein n=1 Tax=marine sediment metagenome TaxID=412755 RepID=X0ZSL1_9ZZZZ
MGIVPALSIRENLILKKYRRSPFSYRGFLDNKEIEENARCAMSGYQIAAPSCGNRPHEELPLGTDVPEEGTESNRQPHPAKQ